MKASNFFLIGLWESENKINVHKFIFIFLTFKLTLAVPNIIKNFYFTLEGIKR